MAMNSIRCPVLGARITQVTDLEGVVTRIICPEYRLGWNMQTQEIRP